MENSIQLTPVLRDKNTKKIMLYLPGVAPQEENLLLKLHPDWYKSTAEENIELKATKYESEMVIER